ncbi:MAG: PQQ-binding-like beta-propeller repeat protein [Planctomycetaceae bacterium]|nr:PQQ-binding-like beta-propeller repeat protein [Planctomycetaceae bacterium]
MSIRKWIGLVGLVGLMTAPGLVAAGDFSAERAHNWHQWRGPDATGVAAHANPPVEWDQTRNLKWKVEIPGHGKSTPIVWGQRVFVIAAVNTGTVVEGATKPEDQPKRQFGITFPNTLYRFVVQCLDRDTGQLLWEKTATEALPHEGHHGDNSHASASPTTDGEFLYVSFGSRGVYCYDLDGQLQWQRKLNDVSTRLSFGEGSSPVVHGDTVLLVRDNETDSRLLAMDVRTGESRWEKKRDESSAWATPVVVEHNGRTQVITNASKRVRSYDLQTGDVIWECGGQVGNVTPSPVLLGEQVICMSGYRGSVAVSLPLAAMGDITDTPQIAWRYDKDTPYVPSPLLYGDLLYFNKVNNGVLTVLDAKTGKPVLEATRLQGISNVYASPVGAADRVYFTSRDGTTVVLKRGTTLELLATNKLDDLVDASPALVGNQIFLRGQKHLYCFENQ